MRKAIEMARHLPASEIRSWLESGKFAMSSGYSLTLFEKIAFDRWALERPADFMGWLVQNSSSQYHRQIKIVVQNHPDRLSRFIDQNSGTSSHRWLLRTLVEVSPDFALAEFRRLLPQLAGREFGYGTALSALMAKRPEELLALFADPDYTGNHELATAVLRHQLNGNFDETFDILLTRFDGYNILFRGNGRLQGVKPDLLLARLPDIPEKWREQLVSYPSGLRALLGNEIDILGLDFTDYGFAQNDANRLRISIAEMEMSRNPNAFLKRLNALGFNRETKEYLLAILAQQGRSEREYEQLASALSESEDRRTLEKAIASFKEENRPYAGQLSNRDELFTVLGQEDENYPQLRLASWDEEERARLEAEFDSLPPEQKNEVSKLIFRSSSGPLSELESKALVHLIKEKSSVERVPQLTYSSYQSPASEHVVELMNHDPREASLWINKLPRGPVRLQAEKNLAANWSNYDPELAQQWIDSQPAETRKALVEFLESTR